MFEFLSTLGGLVGLGITGVAAVGGYYQARKFVRERLRFVDSAHSPNAKWVAGGIALLAAAPVVWLLPFVGAPSAVIFGISVGMGVAKGSRDTKRLTP
jgi:hypothetical protein